MGPDLLSSVTVVMSISKVVVKPTFLNPCTRRTVGLRHETILANPPSWALVLGALLYSSIQYGTGLSADF